MTILAEVSMGATATGRTMGRDLAVGCFASIGRQRLGDAMLEFAARFPDIALSVHEMARSRLLPAMANDELALVLVPGTVAADYPALRLWRDRVKVALPHDHRLARQPVLAVGDLRGEVMLLSRHDHGGAVHRFLSECVDPAGPALEGLLLDAAPAQLIGAVAAGRGLALVCASQTEQLGERVVTRDIDAPGAAFYVHGYWKQPKPDWALAALIALLRETGLDA